jgi:hypothetical protein
MRRGWFAVLVAIAAIAPGAGCVSIPPHDTGTVDGAPGDGAAMPDAPVAVGHDEDDDGIDDALDLCPHMAVETEDGDGDGIGNDCDLDEAIGGEVARFYSFADGDLGDLIAVGHVATDGDDNLILGQAGMNSDSYVLAPNVFALVKAEIRFSVTSSQGAAASPEVALLSSIPPRSGPPDVGTNIFAAADVGQFATRTLIGASEAGVAGSGGYVSIGFEDLVGRLRLGHFVGVYDGAFVGSEIANADGTATNPPGRAGALARNAVVRIESLYIVGRGP